MITQDYLKSILNYDSETGIFTSKINRGYLKPGDILGCKSERDGYILIRIDDVLYFAQRLAYLYVYGIIPDIVDHKDTITSNNRIKNLRAATKSQNGMNSKLRKDSSTGIKGVIYDYRNNSYQARVVLNRKNYTKRFAVAKYGSIEKAINEATKYVQSLRLDLHGEFANHG